MVYESSGQGRQTSSLVLLGTTRTIHPQFIPILSLFHSSHLPTGKADLTLHIINRQLQLPQHLTDQTDNNIPAPTPFHNMLRLRLAPACRTGYLDPRHGDFEAEQLETLDSSSSSLVTCCVRMGKRKESYSVVTRGSCIPNIDRGGSFGEIDMAWGILAYSTGTRRFW